MKTNYDFETVVRIEDLSLVIARLEREKAASDAHLSALANRVAQLMGDGELLGDVQTGHIVADALEFLQGVR